MTEPEFPPLVPTLPAAFMFRYFARWHDARVRAAFRREGFDLAPRDYPL